MTWVVRVDPDAETEYAASARWYDEHAGLRTEFVEAIDAAIFDIAENPHRFPLWRAGLPYRKYVVRRFPYVVVYRVHAEYIEILAFAHTRRRGGHWANRG